MGDDCSNENDPLAYFLTWTTYGTWLPGDERGSWQKGDLKLPSALFREMAASKMTEPAFRMSSRDRKVVRGTVERHCEIRSWHLHAVQARSNHVHTVVTAAGYAPETVRDQFKAWCTRHLKARYPARKKFWTEGGSCRCINCEDDLEAVILYVMEAQDRKACDIQARRASE